MDQSNFLSILLLATACGIAHGQPSDPTAETDGRTTAETASESMIFDRYQLTGSWWGARDRLSEQGVSISAAYVAEYSGVLEGGLRRSDSFRNLLTVDAELDLGTIAGIDGATVFAQYLSVNAEDGGSADAGDIQGYSNIENAKHLDALYELWYEQTLFDDRLRIKIGKVDANSEFAFVEAAGDFANSSAGFSPSVLSFPSYPNPAASAGVFATVLRDRHGAFTLGYGVFDGAAHDGVPTGSRGPSSFFSDDRSDACFHIFQAELTWERDEASHAWFRDARVTVGLWHHTGDFTRFDGGTDPDATGFFLTAESRLFDLDPTPDSPGAGGHTRAVHAFVQYGAADEDVSEVAQHFGAGLVCQGPFASRAGDSLGVYCSLVDLSDHAMSGFKDDELAIDLYYRLQMTPSVFIQPELQAIINPSGDPALDDAIVAGLRVGVNF